MTVDQKKGLWGIWKEFSEDAIQQWRKSVPDKIIRLDNGLQGILFLAAYNEAFKHRKHTEAFYDIQVSAVGNLKKAMFRLSLFNELHKLELLQ